MYIHKLLLNNFRNFENLSLSLEPGINIFLGNNAQGKTNFLESIYICSSGRSQRANNDKELIMFGKDESHIQILISEQTVDNNKSYDKIDMHIKKDEKKGVAVNGITIKKLSQLFGVLLTVIFSPEDLQLVKSGPFERRKFMDMELCQLSKVYYYELQQYHKVLKQRNNLLKKIKIQNDLRETLFIWDKQLEEHGCKIIAYREGFIKKISVLASEIHSKIAIENNERLEILYKPNVIAENFYKKLAKNHNKDIMLGSTTVGIHKDDLSFVINGNLDIRVFGSQGQQRTAALSAKLAEIEIIKERKKNVPVLLLDDVMSELDGNRQKFLLDSIKDIQSIITCTGADSILTKISKKATIYEVEKGNIKKM